MRPMLPHPLLSVVLALVWLVLNESAAPGHLVLAIALGVGVPWITRAFWPDRPPVHRLPRFWRLVLVVNRDVLVANAAVAWLTLTRPQRSLEPKFAEVPLDLENDYAIAILMGIISITPGTVSADLDPTAKRVLVHWLHEPDPQVAIRRIKQRYETPLKEILQ